MGRARVPGDPQPWIPPWETLPDSSLLGGIEIGCAWGNGPIGIEPCLAFGVLLKLIFFYLSEHLRRQFVLAWPIDSHTPTWESTNAYGKSSCQREQAAGPERRHS